MGFLLDNAGVQLDDGAGNFLTDDEPASSTAMGPLAASSDNPRYFAKPDGTCVLLTGSHHWNNFQDEKSNPPSFDFTAYLDFMVARNQNFIRLWREESAREDTGSNLVPYSPEPYARTGPGTIPDGGLKFNLTQFNQPYFDRLRSRIQAAGSRGIYVSIMLFNGWSVSSDKQSGFTCWPCHPYNTNNNVNGINGDPRGTGSGIDTHTMTLAAVLQVQKDYVKNVIDTVNDLENVLYEVSNEDDPVTGDTDWQYAIISYINTYQAGKPNQHPVGMTIPWGIQDGHSGASWTPTMNSAADWVSPAEGSYLNGTWNSTPPDWPGAKVNLLDTDHTRPVASTIDAWVWKGFLRGHNVIHMDGMQDLPSITGDPTGSITGYDEPMRRAMSQVAQYAARCDLRTAVPNSALSSTGFCLAAPGSQYLALRGSGSSSFTVNLSSGSGQSFAVEWLDVVNDVISTAGNIVGGSGAQSFTAPFSGPAVLFLDTGSTTSGSVAENAIASDVTGAAIANAPQLYRYSVFMQ